MSNTKRLSPCETDPLLSPNHRIGKQRRSSAFDYAELFALLGAASIKPICFQVIFPFISQMILENELASTLEEVGFFSGTIESLFAVFAFLSVMPWTYASDSFGRKPVILYGRIGMAVSIAVFGVSKTIWMMIVTRCICGVFGGTQTTVKVMMAEVYPDKEHRIFAFSILQLAIRFGQAGGQTIGGWFTHPERNFNIFDTYFWRKYPFSLPCFIACAMCLLSWLSGTISLRETLPTKPRDFSGQSSSSSSDSSTISICPSENPRVQSRTFGSAMTPQVNAMLVNTFLMTFVSEAFYALYPLYAFTPRDRGGLGFSEARIGTCMAVRAIMIVGVIILSAPLQQKFGTVRMYQFGMATWPLSVIFLPILNLMSRSKEYGENSLWFWLVFSALYMCWGIGSLVWPCIQVITVNVSPSAEDLATVTGLSQVLLHFGEALAPALITSLFAYSLEHRILGGNLTYVALLVIGILGVIQAFTLEERVDHMDKICHSSDVEDGHLEID